MDEIIMPQKRKQRRSYKKPTGSIDIVLEKKLNKNGDIFFKLFENGKYKTFVKKDVGQYYLDNPNIIKNELYKHIKVVNVKTIDSIPKREQRAKETKEALKANETQYVYAMEITLSWPRSHDIILYKQGHSTDPEFRRKCIEENWKMRRSDPEMNISFKIIALEKISKSKEDVTILEEAVDLEKKLLDSSEESKLSWNFWRKHFNIKPLTHVQMSELEKITSVWYAKQQKGNKPKWPDGCTEVRDTLDYPSVNTWFDKNKIGDL